MARRGGDLACLMVAYFIGEGVLVMLFLASEYSRTRLEGCTVTPYPQYNGILLILQLMGAVIVFGAALTSPPVINPTSFPPREGSAMNKLLNYSLLLGAVTVIFSVIYTFYLRSCTNSLGWVGWIMALGLLLANSVVSMPLGVAYCWMTFGRDAINYDQKRGTTRLFRESLMETEKNQNTSQGKIKYKEQFSKANLPQDFNPVDEYFFRKYLVYSTSRQLLDVVIEQGHSCPVCLTNFELNDLIIHAECKDLFHWECLRRHLILNTGCPRQTCLHKTAFLSELRNKVISTTRKDEIGLAIRLESRSGS